MFSGISGGANDEEFDDWKQRVVYRYQNPITLFQRSEYQNNRTWN
jgi:uncharacterized phage protein gp47/JayE